MLGNVGYRCARRCYPPYWMILTGVSLYAFKILSGQEGKVISVGIIDDSGFALTLGIIVIIIGSVSILDVAGRHYSSVYAFNQSVRQLVRSDCRARKSGECV